jgi:hypothetical protein
MKGIIKQVLLATCLIGAPTCVYALPFHQNPQSFQNYMNTRNWSDGSRVIFQNLNRCGGGGIVYGCDDGFATISNPMGTKVCNVVVMYYAQNGTYNYYPYPNKCRYK